MDLGFRMHAERTPNPNSIKWVLSSSIVPDGNGAHFSSPPLPEQSPLAAALFGVPGVAGVFLTLIYQRFPNLWAVGIVHGILGSLAVYIVLKEDPGATIFSFIVG